MRLLVGADRVISKYLGDSRFSGKGAVSLAEPRRLLSASRLPPNGVSASGPQCVGDKADFRRAELEVRSSPKPRLGRSAARSIVCICRVASAARPPRPAGHVRCSGPALGMSPNEVARRRPGGKTNAIPQKRPSCVWRPLWAGSTWLLHAWSRSPGDAGEAAALVLATEEFVASDGRRTSCRRRQSAASPGRTGSRGRVGPRGCRRSAAGVSPEAEPAAASREEAAALASACAPKPRGLSRIGPVRPLPLASVVRSASLRRGRVLTDQAMTERKSILADGSDGG